jgi:hypothetical protein
MAIVGSELLNHVETQNGVGLLDRRGEAGQVVLRASSGRAYAFEVHPQEAVSDLAEIGAVYCYARAVPAANCAIDFSGAGLEIGYVGKTADLGRQDSEHEARGDFAGYGFDIVLVLRSEEAALRADIKRELVETFSPVLNDLLRSIECGEVS